MSSVGMASKEAIYSMTANMSPALEGIEQSKRGKRIMIYCALIMSHKYCSEAVINRFINKFAANTPVAPALIKEAVPSTISFSD